MSKQITDKAFILAAGFGTRLRPYTNDVPKPMVSVAGRSLIYRTLDKLRASNINDVVVNAHYLSDVLVRHMDEYCAQHPQVKITVSIENDVLDTGGGVKNIVQHFKGDPFFVIAGDNLWTDNSSSCFERLMKNWDAEGMDILTLMQPVETMTLTRGVGDYDIDAGGRVCRSLDKSGQYMWTNIRLNHPRIYDDSPDGAFSFLTIMDECQRQGRFFALEHDGDWHHISTPQDLETVDAHFKKCEQE